MTYIMLSGYPPFNVDEDNDALLYKLIERGQFDFPDSEWSGISNLAKDFLFKTIKKDTAYRLTAE